VSLAHAEAAKETRYEIELPQSLELIVGKEASLSLSLVPAAEHRIDVRAPIRVAIAVPPESGISTHRTRLSGKNIVDKESRIPRFALKLSGSKVGQVEIGFELRFWVCRRKICHPVQATRNMKVNVREEETAPETPQETPPETQKVRLKSLFDQRL
jgi:hypothetical protein